MERRGTRLLTPATRPSRRDAQQILEEDGDEVETESVEESEDFGESDEGGENGENLEADYEEEYEMAEGEYDTDASAGEGSVGSADVANHGTPVREPRTTTGTADAGLHVQPATTWTNVPQFSADSDRFHLPSCSTSPEDLQKRRKKSSEGTPLFSWTASTPRPGLGAFAAPSGSRGGTPLYRPNFPLVTPRPKIAVAPGSFSGLTPKDARRGMATLFSEKPPISSNGKTETANDDIDSTLFLGAEYETFAKVVVNFMHKDSINEVIGSPDGAQGMAAQIAAACDAKMQDVSREIQLDPSSHEPDEPAIWEAERNTWILVQELWSDRQSLRQLFANENTDMDSQATADITGYAPFDIRAARGIHESDGNALMDGGSTGGGICSENVLDVYVCPCCDRRHSQILEALHTTCIYSPIDRVRAHFRFNCQARKAKVVRSWLERIAKPIVPVDAQQGYRFSTMKAKIQRDRQQKLSMSIDADLANIVTALDPDAPQRLGKVLQLEDENFERELNRTLYELVRRGQIEEVEKMCKDCDQHWRAASIRGRNFLNENFTGTNVEYEEVSSYPQGNGSRDLWLATSYAIASAENGDPYEKALYGAVIGDFASVAAVSETWEDYVWAYINQAVEVLCTIVSRNTPDGRASCGLIMPPEHWMTSMQFFDILGKSDRLEIRKQAEDPFRRIQAYLINGEIKELVTFVRQLLELTGATNSKTNPSFCRFAAHLVVYLMHVEPKSVPLEDAYKIVVMFIDNLVAGSKHTIISTYTRKLPPDQQVEVFSRFLKGVNGSIEVRAFYLQTAAQMKLDVLAIAVRTRQLVMTEYDNAMERAGFQSSTCVTVLPLDRELEISDLRRIRAFEWDWVRDGVRFADLEKELAALCRRFLVLGKANAVKAVFFTHIPEHHRESLRRYSSKEFEQSNAKQLESDMYFGELKQYWNLVQVLDAYTVWAEMLCTRPITELMVDDCIPAGVEEWLVHFRAVTEDVLERIHDLLVNFDLLGERIWHRGVFRDTTDKDIERHRELERLRDIYVPELFFRWHEVLYESRDFVHGNLFLSLDLAREFVMLDRRKPDHVFRHFVRTNQLRRFAELMRLSSLETLKYTRNPFNARNLEIEAE